MIAVMVCHGPTGNTPATLVFDFITAAESQAQHTFVVSGPCSTLQLGTCVFTQHDPHVVVDHPGLYIVFTEQSLQL